MKTLKTCVTAAVILLASLGSAFAQFKGSSMGMLTSIVSDGSYDTSRNPALLVLQPAEPTCSLLLRYRTLDDYKYSIDNAPADIELGEPSTTVMSGNASCSFKAGGGRLGFAVGDAGKDLYSMSKQDTSFSNPVAPGVIQDESAKTTEMNPVLTSALGWQLTNESSVGIQLFTGYSQKVIDSTRELVVSGLVSEKIDTERTIQDIGAALGIGYLHHSRDYQVGVLLRSGPVILQREQMEMKYSDIRDPSSVPPGIGMDGFNNSTDSTRSTPLRFMYAEGMSITAGGYKRLSQSLAFGLESAYTIGNSHTDEDLVLVDDPGMDYYDLQKITLSMHSKDTIALRGGVDITLAPPLSLTGGGGYEYRRLSSGSDDDDSHSRSKSTLNLYYATLGIHYLLNGRTALSLVAVGVKLSGDGKLEEESFSLGLDQDVYLLDMAFGVSTTF